MSPRLQRTLLILLVAYFMLFGGTVYTELNPTLRVVHQGLMLALLAGWLLELWRRGRGFPATPLDLPLLAYLGAWLLAALLALDARVSLEYAWPILAQTLGLYLLIDLMRRGRTRWIIEALLVVAAVIVAMSLLELAGWYFGLPVQPGFVQGWPQVGAGLLPPAGHKLALPFNVSTRLGNSAATLLPLAAAWAMTVRGRGLRGAGGLLAALLLLVLILSGSRGGLIGAAGAVGLFGLLWLWREENRARFPVGLRPLLDRRLLLGLTALAGMGMVAVLLVTTLRAGQSGDLNRLDLWRSALAMARDDLLTGVGPYQFGAALRVYGDPVFAASQAHLATAHNLALHTLAESGLAGLGASLWVLGALLRLWWRRWNAASPAVRRRLEGALGALLAFGLHSMVDVFFTVQSLVPVLAALAYIVAGDAPRPAYLTAPEHAAPGRRRTIPAALAALLVVQLAFLPVHASGLAYGTALNALNRQDYPAALERLGAAHAADPWLGLYPLHEAYVLGLLAQADPAYLDEAIAAHERGLETINNTWDVGWHNLAALYAQAGRFGEAALAEAEAIRWHPVEAGYHLRLGEYAEAQGDDEAMRAALHEALRLQPQIIASSGFWSDPAHPNRAALRDDLLAAFAPADLARAALPWESYLEHAEAALDGLDPTVSYRYSLSSEQAARAALFISEGAARRAWYVLAQLAEMQGAGEAEVRDLLVQAAPVISASFSFSAVVYGRVSQLYVLPQAGYPLYSRADLEPLQALAERLAAQGGDPRPAYALLLAADPYRQDVRDQLNALPPS